MWKRIALIAVLASVRCSPVEHSIEENLVGAVSECIDKDTSLCLKEKALKYTERLAITKDINLFEGMTLINTGSARSARSYEQLSENPKTREMQIDERIANDVGDFLDNHVLQLRLSDSEDSTAVDEEEGRGKKGGKKKIKKILPLLLLLKLKLAALVPLFLGIIAFAAVKAVFLGKIAFALNAFSVIRKLLSKNSHGSSAVSYTQHHDDHSGYNYEPAQGWSRKVNDGQSMAYAGQLSN
ncbi:uncharacterized protein LOC112055078 [Bicyclus anynana]|uniref:Uncharacterized protein LOC112055078 n=1 Tax=Bicyclus anynana TaxID=110368 RepID=A0A6J1P2S6_BICAN|nr:uncharacterized protein LOC112055078 [Bicyclus anynana]